MAKLTLTRESILDGSLRASSKALLGPGVVFMTDEERTRQIKEMLRSTPRPERVWVFGFGSLIWNPAFHFAERRTALVRGYHRQFCLWARAGRGSPQSPGLMLALERGESNRPRRLTNPENGRYGEIVPTTPYQRSGLDCRDYTHTVYIDGRPETMRGAACRNRDGTWSTAT